MWRPEFRPVGFPRRRGDRPHRNRPCVNADGRGSEVSLRGLLENLAVQGELGQGPLEPAVLRFQLLESTGLVDGETTVLGPASVEGLPRDADATSALNSRTARGNDHLRLLELVDGLFCCVFSLARFSSPALPRIPTSILDRFPGVRTTHLGTGQERHRTASRLERQNREYRRREKMGPVWSPHNLLGLFQMRALINRTTYFGTLLGRSQ